MKRRSFCAAMVAAVCAPFGAVKSVFAVRAVTEALPEATRADYRAVAVKRNPNRHYATAVCADGEERFRDPLIEMEFIGFRTASRRENEVLRLLQG